MSDAILQFRCGFLALPRARQMAAYHGLSLENHGGLVIKRVTVRGPQQAVADFAVAVEAQRRIDAQEGG